jgi:hypothetical protein
MPLIPTPPPVARRLSSRPRRLLTPLSSPTPSLLFPYSSIRSLASNIWDAAAACTVAWQRSGALEAFPRYHDNRSRWTNREAELLSWVAAGQVHLWTMLGARGLPATGLGGQRQFALLWRSLSFAETSAPRGGEDDGWWRQNVLHTNKSLGRPIICKLQVRKLTLKFVDKLPAFMKLKGSSSYS